MGQMTSTVQVANAFPHNLYIKVDVRANNKSGTGLMDVTQANKVNDNGSMNGNVISTNEQCHELNTRDILSEPGFRLVPTGDVTDFHPTQELSYGSKTVYVSVFYIDKTGKTEVLHDSTQFSANSRLIVTSDGAIVNAIETNPWVGQSNGKNYKPKSTFKELYC